MDRCATAGSLQDLHVSLSGPVSSAGSFRQCQNKLNMYIFTALSMIDRQTVDREIDRLF